MRGLVKQHRDKDWSLLARYMTTRSAVFAWRYVSGGWAFECVCVCVLLHRIFLLLFTGLATGVLIVTYILNMSRDILCQAFS